MPLEKEGNPGRQRHVSLSDCPRLAPVRASQLSLFGPHSPDFYDIANVLNVTAGAQPVTHPNKPAQDRSSTPLLVAML